MGTTDPEVRTIDAGTAIFAFGAKLVFRSSGGAIDGCCRHMGDDGKCKSIPDAKRGDGTLPRSEARSRRRPGRQSRTQVRQECRTRVHAGARDLEDQVPHRQPAEADV